MNQESCHGFYMAPWFEPWRIHLSHGDWTQTYDAVVRQQPLRIAPSSLRSNVLDFELVLRQATSREIDSGVENLRRDWVS